MSRESVEIVRRWFAAIAAGGLAPDLWDADLIVDNIPEFPVTGPYRGYAGLQRWWDDLAEVVEGARVQLDEATRLDDERVLTIQRLVGEMAYTRIPVDTPWAAIWIVRRGKLRRVSGYATRKQALEAAGLSDEPMSRENVEIVRRSVEHWNDTGEPLWELLDPDIEYVMDPPASLAGSYRGLAQFKWLNSRGAKLFDEFRYELDELLPAGDLVVSLGGIRMRGALSGASAVQKGCGVWELRDGRIVRVRMYFDREAAFRDAGLAE